MDRDDAIRKVQSLRKTARHAATGAEESETAGAMAEKLIAKYNLTEEDLVEHEDTTSFFGIKLGQDFHRRSATYYRLKKEAEDALYRLAAFLQEEDNAPWRMDRTYEAIDKQLTIAKAQFKKCDKCNYKGFDGRGLVTSYDLGWKTKSGRTRRAWLHETCLDEWKDEVWKAKERRANDR